MGMRGYGLQLRTSCYQCLAGLVVGVLAEVLDEAGSQILGLLFPLASAVVSVTRIEDSGVHIGQRSGNLEVEHRNLLGLSLQNGTIENGVDDVIDGTEDLLDGRDANNQNTAKDRAANQ